MSTGSRDWLTHEMRCRAPCIDFLGGREKTPTGVPFHSFSSSLACPHGHKSMASSSPHRRTNAVTTVHSHHQSSVTTISTAKVFDLSNVFNERAGPRGEGVRFTHNFNQSPPTSPRGGATTPDYTHVVNLYPNLSSPQPREKSSSPYRYSPVTTQASNTVTMPLPQQQVPTLPVDSQGIASLGPLSVDVRDSPTLSVASVSSSRTDRTDTEAEVDALTSLLLQGLDTVSRTKRARTSSAASSTTTTTTPATTNTSNKAAIIAPNTNTNGPKPADPLLSKSQPKKEPKALSPEDSTATDVRPIACDHNNACFRCTRVIPHGEHVHLSALRTRFHVNCFTCYSCGIALAPATNPAGSVTCPPAAYFHAGDRLLCDRCVISTVESCHACGRSIAERLLRALGRAYHPHCFVCSVCSQALDGRAFTVDVHGRLHCLEDFHKRYAPRCHGCGETIAPGPGENEARRVVSGGHSFHLSCHPPK